MENNTIQIQSERRHCYEFALDTSKFDEDEWGTYYRGTCKDSDHPKNVTICELHSKRKYPEHLLYHLDSFLHHFKHFKHPNIIPMIDYVTVKESDESDWHFYMIEEEAIGVTLSDFLQGHICDVNGNESKDIAELYALFQKDRSEFAKRTISEILQGVRCLHDSAFRMKMLGLNSVIVSCQGMMKIRIMHSWMKYLLMIPTDPFLVISSMTDNIE